MLGYIGDSELQCLNYTPEDIEITIAYKDDSSEFIRKKKAENVRGSWKCKGINSFLEVLEGKYPRQHLGINPLSLILEP